MYFSNVVSIPDIKGKIVSKKKKDATYVLYEIERVYNKEKKYNVPKRVVIGKVCESDVSTMFPNESYYDYFSADEIPEIRETAYRSSCIKVGANIAINNVIDEYKLKDKLIESFEDDTSLVLDLAAYSIITEDNVAQHYPEYAFSHPLSSNDMSIASDEKISRLLKSITPNMRASFLKEWNKGVNKKNRVYVSYDSTNKNCQAGDIDFVEYGNAKDDDSKGIINLSIAFDNTNSIPLFYEEYPGSINDVSQFKYFVGKLNGMGYKNVGLILDRGYFSEENINHAVAEGHPLVIMMKGRKSLVRAIVEKTRGSFERKRKCFISSYEMYGTTVKERLFDKDKSEKYIHIYYSTNKLNIERHSFEERLKRLDSYIKRFIGEAFTPTKEISNYYNILLSKDGKLLSYHENEERVEKELEMCGYFCIVTTDNMSAEEALLLYKGRDSSEKLFSSAKSFLGGRSLRVHSNESAANKFFIEFIALIIRNRMHTLTKELSLKLGRRVNYLNVPSIIAELEKIELVRTPDGKYRLDHAITKTQKLILSAFGISEENAKSEAIRMANILSANQEANNSRCEEDCLDESKEY